MNGRVVRVTDKGFGFVKDENGTEYFFHRSGYTGYWEDLIEDSKGKMIIKVEFDIEPAEKSEKGPRATNVRRVDWPNQA